MRYLRSLPYGRIASRADCAGVLTERRGTCSTKHALLARLAAWRIREACIAALGVA